MQKADVKYKISADNAKIAVGSYTGDDQIAQAIVGIGFQPIFVKVWIRETLNNTTLHVYETTPVIIDDNVAGGAVRHNMAADHSFVINALISLDVDGFTVDDNGANSNPNSNGVVYNYMCIG